MKPVTKKNAGNFPLEKRLYDTKEAAFYLSFSVRQIQRWVEEGLLFPSRKLPDTTRGPVRFEKTELDRFANTEFVLCKNEKAVGQ